MHKKFLVCLYKNKFLQMFIHFLEACKFAFLSYVPHNVSKAFLLSAFYNFEPF
jgi:hypothetical protein